MRARSAGTSNSSSMPSSGRHLLTNCCRAVWRLGFGRHTRFLIYRESWCYSPTKAENIMKSGARMTSVEKDRFKTTLMRRATSRLPCSQTQVMKASSLRDSLKRMSVKLSRPQSARLHPICGASSQGATDLVFGEGQHKRLRWAVAPHRSCLV